MKITNSMIQKEKREKGENLEIEVSEIFQDNNINVTKPLQKAPMQFYGSGKFSSRKINLKWDVDIDRRLETSRGDMLAEIKSGYSRDMTLKLPHQMDAIGNHPELGDLPRILIYEDRTFKDTKGEHSDWKKVLQHHKEVDGERLIHAIIPVSKIEEWIDNGCPINDEEGSVVYSDKIRVKTEIVFETKREVVEPVYVPPKKKSYVNRKKIDCDSCDEEFWVGSEASSAICTSCVSSIPIAV
jgi:hypothetical protein